MKSGRLRYRVRIDAATNGVDAFGAPTKVWTQIAEVQASIDSVSGREYLSSARDLAEESVRILIREVPGVHVDGSYRVTDVDSGAVYDTTAVLDPHYRNFLTLIAKSGTAHP